MTLSSPSNNTAEDSFAETDALAQYLENTFGADNPVNEVIADANSADLAPSALSASSSSSSSSAAAVAAAPASASMDTSSTEPIFLIGTVGDTASLFGSNEDEFIAGRFGDSVLFGNGGNDTLIGDLEGEGNDKLFAGKGNDDVLGNGGNDILFGEEGDDFLFGGEGNDYLRGGKGDDSLFGGTGTDIFALFPGEGADVVFDFEAPRDIIGLGSGITFDQLTIAQQGSATVISFNGETLASVLNTTAADFTQDTFLAV